MTDTIHPNHKIHQGRNVKRFREMLGIKQDALAYELGEDWNQQKVSLLEQKETIETQLLQQISAVLKIPVEAIQNFDEEKAIVNIQNNYEGSNPGVTNVAGYQYNNECTFNPLDKMVELYERMLQQQKEMIDRLEKLIQK
ncbi:Helix-turn-helix domain [Sphingobacterium spiritivorum]|uniref:Helix-turn-helix domain n=1 Tax=Sphingobacterium spiritivorum TaxID=258 RepID=A0A380BI91_SPHSI|nr:helix-turn-helix transcriptional regulator [Sphingobacterium spiritivorum]SUJ01067.1 Helix-turn-helix domain [Sphingobacterium spiritivorum]